MGTIRGAQTGTTTEWSYTGEQNDPTGLEYLRARYYDASTGRFLSQDPLPLLQRYAYANDNPANLVDPSGLSPFEQLMAAERAVQAAARQILADPCWKTRAFCPHPSLLWKGVKKIVQNPYVQECAIWKGAAFVASGFDAPAAGIGCATGIASRLWTHHVSNDPISQCAIWGVGGALTAGGAAATAGRNYGCAAGAVSWADSRFGPNTPKTQCVDWGAPAVKAAGPTLPSKVLAGAAGCIAGIADTLVSQ